MSPRPCVCGGSNENCSHCFGRGFIDDHSHKKSTVEAKKSSSDERVREFVAKHPLLNPNPLHQPEGTQAKYHPRPKEALGEEFRDVAGEQSATYASSSNVRSKRLHKSMPRVPHLDLAKVKKEIATSTCPSCGREFPHYIDLVAHQQEGCPKPKTPLQRFSATPREVHKSRRGRPYVKPSKMVRCSYCGCFVKRTKLQRHFGRCPKYAAGQAKSANWNAQKPASTKTPQQKAFHSAADAKKPDPRTAFAQANALDPIDATRLYAHSFRENGKYGSHPLHDGMDDESGPE